MSEPISIMTIQGDYDVLIGKRWQRGFNRLWKAKLYRFYLRMRRSLLAAFPDADKRSSQ